MIFYDFFDIHKLQIIRYDDSISENNLLQLIPFMLEEVKRNKAIFVLNDFRNASFAFGIDKLKEISQKRIDIISAYNNYKSIHLVNNTIATAYSYFFKERVKDDVEDVTVCTTLQYVIDFFGLSFSEQKLENKIQSLKYQFNSR